jgi:MoaA/NifB/PqqE/SkfB family radical SAM enzyme
MRLFRDIVIMGKCNLKCLYCGGFTHDVDVNKTIQCLDTILKRFKPEDSCFRVELRGEITLFPGLIEFLEKKAEENYLIEILSNGILAEDVLHKDSGLRYVFSLDGHTEKMNKMRNLDQEKVDKILDNIFKFNAEIQCVYFRQTLDQINEFITYLKNRGFKRMLHIFPCYLNGEMVSRHLEYDELEKADFLAPKEYFERWKYISQNKKRIFKCDYFVNGYSYYISNGDIKMVKCDGSTDALDMVHPFGDELSYESFPCNMCINHNE